MSRCDFSCCLSCSFHHQQLHHQSFPCHCQRCCSCPLLSPNTPPHKLYLLQRGISTSRFQTGQSFNIASRCISLEEIIPINHNQYQYTSGISGALALIAGLAVMMMIPVVEALSIIYFCPVVTMGCAALMLGMLEIIIYIYLSVHLQEISLILQRLCLELFSSQESCLYASLHSSSHQTHHQARRTSLFISWAMEWPSPHVSVAAFMLSLSI